MFFLQNGQLIIENGASLIIEDGARIIGDLCETESAIQVMGDMSVGRNIQFSDLPGGIMLGKPLPWGMPYDDYKQCNLHSVDFYNAPIIHRGSRLNIDSCIFDHSNINTAVSRSYIRNSSFLESEFVSTHGFLPFNPDAMKPAYRRPHTANRKPAIRRLFGSKYP